jgi:hypothetical protein
MAEQVSQATNREDLNTVAQHLRRLVTRGPRDLDIAYAMAGYGYDAVKWAEGESVLAELVGSDWPEPGCLAMAIRWYNEAAKAAWRALVAEPELLDKLGVTEGLYDQL